VRREQRATIIVNREASRISTHNTAQPPPSATHHRRGLAWQVRPGRAPADRAVERSDAPGRVCHAMAVCEAEDKHKIQLGHHVSLMEALLFNGHFHRGENSACARSVFDVRTRRMHSIVMVPFLASF